MRVSNIVSLIMSVDSDFEKYRTISGAKSIPRATVSAVRKDTRVSVAEIKVWVSFFGISSLSK